MRDQRTPQPPLVRAMLRPEFYPHRPARVRLAQTHISWVFLADDLVYKVKKPVDFGFLDFSTPAKRARACEDEVRLNRRLAPDLYRGVVPIYRKIPLDPPLSKGERKEEFSLVPDGDVVEHAVLMRRLPEERLLSTLLARREASPADVRRVSRRIAAFHAGAPGAEPGRHRIETLQEILRENFRQTLPFLGKTVTEGDYILVWDYSRDFLERRRALLEKRIRDGKIRDGHGDLHAGHICLEGAKVLIYDCIEFSPRLRQVDVASDIAFLYMDLLYHRRPDLASALMEEYLRRANDWEVRLLVPFYACYRAVVREKVESFRLADPGIPRSQKKAAAHRAAHYFHLARDLARRDARPRLFLIGGLPGSGKSTIARLLAEIIGAAHFNSDLLRKELTGAAPGARASSSFGAGLYAPHVTELTYRELLLRSERELIAGRSVVLDATFQRTQHRHRAEKLARTAGAMLVTVECRCPMPVAMERLKQRQLDGSAVSDAGWEVYQAMRRSFERFGPDTLRLNTTLGIEDSLAKIAQRAYPL